MFLLGVVSPRSVSWFPVTAVPGFLGRGPAAGPRFLPFVLALFFALATSLHSRCLSSFFPTPPLRVPIRECSDRGYRSQSMLVCCFLNMIVFAKQTS